MKINTFYLELTQILEFQTFEQNAMKRDMNGHLVVDFKFLYNFKLYRELN